MLRKVWDFIVLKVVGKITWEWFYAWRNGGKYWLLTPEERTRFRLLLIKNYFFILTRRKTHLTTYFIALGDFLKTGKWGYWSHALLNMEGDVIDVKLVEATGEGTHYTDFYEVFDCDSATLLVPKGFTPDEWTAHVDRVLDEEIPKQIGKKYDTLFDFKHHEALSCIEVCLVILQQLPDYKTRFQNFDRLLQEHGAVTPQMMYDCGEFYAYFEARH
jgi:hypothetical protein